MIKSRYNFYINLYTQILLEILKIRKINLDFERFSHEIDFLSTNNRFLNFKEKIARILKLKQHLKFLKKISPIYTMLEDKYSKKILIELIKGRILGFNRIKLPLNNRKYWRVRSKVKSLIVSNEFINSSVWNLNFFNLNKINIPIQLFNTPSGLFNIFFTEQYSYRHEKLISAEEGDIVLDAGGGWGDTSLYFASKVKSSGYVYVFEFIPNNIEIINRNLNLNPQLKKIIKIIEKPLWNISNIEFFFTDNGPSSHLRFQSSEVYSEKVKTITIDEFIEMNNISKVNFIKMDIEGAELEALKGARNTLVKNRPKLAISIYHKNDHFFQIPKFIKSLNLNYKLYVDHFTTHAEESILFAISE